MSEFEIGILRQRAQEAYRQKIQRGEVLTMVPVGYDAVDPDNRLVAAELEARWNLALNSAAEAELRLKNVVDDQKP